MENEFSIVSWLIVLIWLALVGVPVSRILGRLGFSKWWTVLAFVPAANLIGLWLLAWTKWPAAPAADPASGA